MRRFVIAPAVEALQNDNSRLRDIVPHHFILAVLVAVQILIESVRAVILRIFPGRFHPSMFSIDGIPHGLSGTAHTVQAFDHCAVF